MDFRAEASNHLAPLWLAALAALAIGSALLGSALLTGRGDDLICLLCRRTTYIKKVYSRILQSRSFNPNTTDTNDWTVSN